jgi:ribose transport system ATP-binding protein
LLGQFLSFFDGVKKRKISLLASTNDKGLVDKAAERPGRFNFTLDYSFLDEKQIIKVCDIHLPEQWRVKEVYDALTGTINGKKVKINNPAAAVANGIGYLSEDRKRYGVLLNQDVKFNLVLSNLRRLTSKIGFVNTSKSKGLSNDAVKNLIIRTPSINQMVKNLSGGNQQKVVIGKWLTRETDILIFDEPTRGIDVGAKDEVYKLIGELAKAGKSIIMISSELPEVLRMSDRILVMCEGRVTGILTNKEADQNLIMQYATKYR